MNNFFNEFKKSFIFILFFFSICVFINNGSLSNVDSYYKLKVTERLLMSAKERTKTDANLTLLAKRRLYNHPIGTSILMTPFYLAGKSIAPLFLSLPPLLVTKAVVSFINSIFVPLCAYIFFQLLLMIGTRPKVAFATSCLFIFATMMLPYARGAWSEPQAIFFFLLSTYFLFKYKNTRRLYAIFFSGVSIAAAALIRYEYIVFIAPSVVYIYIINASKPKQFIIGALLCICSFILIYAPLCAFYNKIHLGSFLPFGYSYLPGWDKKFYMRCIITFCFVLGWLILSYFVIRLAKVPKRAAIFSLLFFAIFFNFFVREPTVFYTAFLSPGNSIFLYSPPIALFFFSIAQFINKHRQEAIYLVTCIAVYLIFIFVVERGALPTWCWGHRYLLVLIPLMMLPAVMLIENIRRYKDIIKGAIFGIIIFGAFVQILGVLFNLTGTFQGVQGLSMQIDNTADRPHYKFFKQQTYMPENSPIRLHFIKLTHLLKKGIMPKTEEFDELGPAEKIDSLLRADVPDFWWVYCYYFGLPLGKAVLIFIFNIALTIFSWLRVKRLFLSAPPVQPKYTLLNIVW